MTKPYDEPRFQPPADIGGAEARAYERPIVSLLEDAMAPWLTSVEPRGERPDPEIVMRLGDGAYRFALWKSEYPTDGAAGSPTSAERRSRSHPGTRIPVPGERGSSSGRCWARTSDLRLVETALSQLS